MTRRWGKTISIDVDIEEDEVLSQISDETIREEAESRGLTVTSAKSDVAEAWRDFADDLRSAAGDRLHLEVMIVRMLAMAGVPRMSIPKKEPAKA